MYLVGNWKMHGSKAFTLSHLGNIAEQIADLAFTPSSAPAIVHCPPSLWLDAASEVVKDSPIQLGAQDCHYQQEGAYTGDTSPAYLKEAGCGYVILGHSERRYYHQESNEMVAKKVAAALRYGLEPIICIGETERECLEQEYPAIIEAQLAESLSHFPKKRQSVIVAYEPSWAIGSGTTPAMEEIERICQHITRYLHQRGIHHPSVLYGGSVKGTNASAILSLPSVDGVLVGGASLVVQEWTDIMKAAKSVLSGNVHHSH